MLFGNDFVIGEEMSIEHPALNVASCGLVKRNFETHPLGVYGDIPAAPKDMPLIPWHEFPERIKDMTLSGSLLTMKKKKRGIKSFYQNGQGFCWAYGPTIAAVLLNIRNGNPFVRLSPHAVACKIMNFRDQGAWGAKALEFLIKYGAPSQDDWPENSMSRSLDTPALWQRALKNRVDQSWMDMGGPEYDRNMTVQQMLTLLCTFNPIAGDYDWWGHCVCLADPVDIHPNKDAADPSRYGPRIWNSHGESFGVEGTAVLADSKAWPDNAVAPVSTYAVSA